MGFICLTGWYFKGMAMSRDPQDRRKDFWIKYFDALELFFVLLHLPGVPFVIIGLLLFVHDYNTLQPSDFFRYLVSFLVVFLAWSISYYVLYISREKPEAFFEKALAKAEAVRDKSLVEAEAVREMAIAESLAIIDVTGAWFVKGLVMGDPLDVRANAWIDAFAVFRKVNLDAWAVYNNAIAEAEADASPVNVDACARYWYGTYGGDVRNILEKARADVEKARADAYAKANAVRENAIAEARAILEKALAYAEKNKGK